MEKEKSIAKIECAHCHYILAHEQIYFPDGSWTFKRIAGDKRFKIFKTEKSGKVEAFYVCPYCKGKTKIIF